MCGSHKILKKSWFWSLSLILGNQIASFSGPSFTCKVYIGSHWKVTSDKTPKTPNETLTAFISSSLSEIILTVPSARIILKLIAYSDNSFPLVPWVPVDKAPPIVIVLISGKQGIHQPVASIIYRKSQKIIPDWTGIVGLEPSKDITGL